MNDEETMPCYFSQFCSQCKSYNYGFSGYGPQAMLAKLEDDRITSEIEEERGILIYTFVDHHIPRAVGTMSIHNLWGSRMPYYVIGPDGKVLLKGDFTTGRPLTAFLYGLLGKSQICQYFRVNLPLRLTDQHMLLTCKMIEQAKRVFTEKFQGDGFFVLLYPSCLSARKMIRYFEEKGIDYFDYSHLSEYTAGQYIIHGEDHPSALGHFAIAARLVRDITALAGSGGERRLTAP